MKIRLLLFLLIIFTILPEVFAATTSPVLSVRKDSDGVTLQLKPGTLKLRVFSARVVEVVYAPGNEILKAKSLSVIHGPERVSWTLNETMDDVLLLTDVITVRVSRASGAVGFCDKTGKSLLQEKINGGKSLAPTRTGGLDTLRSEQVFEHPPDEALFGLGQHPDAAMNYHVQSFTCSRRTASLRCQCYFPAAVTGFSGTMRQ
jgi:alpha-D-xyloside xylohydrolase